MCLLQLIADRPLLCKGRCYIIYHGASAFCGQMASVDRKIPNLCFSLHADIGRPDTASIRAIWAGLRPHAW